MKVTLLMTTIAAGMAAGGLVGWFVVPVVAAGWFVVTMLDPTDDE